MAFVSSPSVKITMRLPDASRKLNALNSSTLSLDARRDHRALIGEPRELDRVADERDAEQDVVVVVREGRDDVRLVAELDERDEIAVLARAAQLHEALGGGDRREERRPRSGRAC